MIEPMGFLCSLTRGEPWYQLVIDCGSSRACIDESLLMACALSRFIFSRNSMIKVTNLGIQQIFKYIGDLGTDTTAVVAAYTDNNGFGMFVVG